MIASVHVLNHDQLNGCACVVCGGNYRQMLPIGPETSISTHVFRCDRPECVVEPDEVQRWIDESDKPAGKGGAAS